MSTTTLTAPTTPSLAPELITLNPQQAIRAYNLPDTAIAKMREEYLPLVVNGVDDKAGEKRVHEARMVVRRHRVEVENMRKRLKADSLEFGRVVDKEAKRLTELLEPIEAHLQAEEDAVLDERRRIKEARLQARVDKLLAVESTLPISVVEAMPDDKFEAFLADATRGYEARKELERRQAEERAEQARQEAAARAQREAEEAAKRKAEEERLAEERRKLEADRQRAEAAREEARRIQQQELDAEKARVAAERKALEEERAKLAAEQRKAELEKARAHAEERAKREEAARIERERVEAEERERVAAEARERAEALRPDREKLFRFIESVLSLERPEVSPDAVPVLGRLNDALLECDARMREIVCEEMPA